jgi:N utilization substance protein A
VVAELGGEKIDVIPWSDDPDVFVANALSPAQVVAVEIDEGERIASVTVPERMLSLAIGREGQNARLAAKLTGWRIDIRSETGASDDGQGVAAPPAVAEPEVPDAAEPAVAEPAAVEEAPAAEVAAEAKVEAADADEPAAEDETKTDEEPEGEAIAAEGAAPDESAEVRQ